jgi:hypothetical protein
MAGEENKNGLLNTLLGNDGLEATLHVKLDKEVYVMLGIVIVAGMLLGSLLGGIAKDVIIKK